MKVRLFAVQNDDSSLIVSFRSQAGDAVAVWRSTKLRPIIGQEYEAELDANVVLQDEMVIAAPNSGNKNQLERVGSKTHLVATVERVDDDCMAYLRLAPDCLLMVESEGRRIGSGAVVSLNLEPTELQVTPNG